MSEPTGTGPFEESEIPPEFASIADILNVEFLMTQRIAIVGVGTAGSQIAQLLANSGIGYLLLIDHDWLEARNVIRHALLSDHVGMNKAEALAVHLQNEIPNLKAGGLPWKVDQHMSDQQIDELLTDADLIVAATDDRVAQRRIGRRALALDIPAIFPSLYRTGGGEVFVQYDSRSPCFLCWDAFRPADENPRGTTATNADTWGLIGLAVELILGALDGNSEYARLLSGDSGDDGPPQLFVLNRHALAIRPVPRRPGCPSCRVGPAAGWSAASAPPTVQPNPPPSPRVSSQAPARPDLEELRQRVRSTAYSALGTAAGIVIITTIVIIARMGLPGAYVLAATWIIGLWILYVNTTDCIGAWNLFRRARNVRDSQLRRGQVGE